MGILFNLMPLDLEMERIAIKTYCRIRSKLPRIWDGRPTGAHWTKSEYSVRLRPFLKINFSNFFLHPALPHTELEGKSKK
jgi:hypothetical protein